VVPWRMTAGTEVELVRYGEVLRATKLLAALCVLAGWFLGAGPSLALANGPAHGSYSSFVVSGGTLKILSDTKYELDDYQGGDPMSGRYSYDAPRHKVIWESGFAKQQHWKSKYHRDGRVIDVTTPGGGFNMYTWYEH
jgi:hypothetical protein